MGNDQPTLHARNDVHVDLTKVPRRSYFFGTEGGTLGENVAIAGSLGSLLFGYDQGVLGVGFSTRDQRQWTC